MTSQSPLFTSGCSSSAESCPFFDPNCSACRAARLAFMPDSKHLYSYCCNDDHDSCALFLAQALRSSASGGHSRDVAVYCEK